MARIDEYLEEILKRNGSDLHLMAGGPPRIRQYGKLKKLREDLLAAIQAREIDPDDAYVYATDKRAFSRHVVDRSLVPRFEIGD